MAHRVTTCLQISQSYIYIFQQSQYQIWGPKWVKTRVRWQVQLAGAVGSWMSGVATHLVTLVLAPLDHLVSKLIGKGDSHSLTWIRSNSWGILTRILQFQKNSKSFHQTSVSTSFYWGNSWNLTTTDKSSQEWFVVPLFDIGGSISSYSHVKEQNISSFQTFLRRCLPRS